MFVLSLNIGLEKFRIGLYSYIARVFLFCRVLKEWSVTLGRGFFVRYVCTQSRHPLTRGGHHSQLLFVVGIGVVDVGVDVNAGGVVNIVGVTNRCCFLLLSTIVLGDGGVGVTTATCLISVSCL